MREAALLVSGIVRGVGDARFGLEGVGTIGSIVVEGQRFRDPCEKGGGRFEAHLSGSGPFEGNGETITEN